MLRLQTFITYNDAHDRMMNFTLSRSSSYHSKATQWDTNYKKSTLGPSDGYWCHAIESENYLKVVKSSSNSSLLVLDSSKSKPLFFQSENQREDEEFGPNFQYPNLILVFSSRLFLSWNSIWSWVKSEKVICIESSQSIIGFPTQVKIFCSKLGLK